MPSFPWAMQSSTFSFYLPLIIMIVIYSKLFKITMHHKKAIRRATLITRGSPVGKQRKRFRFYQSEKKAAYCLGIIIGAFLVCWFPFFSINPIFAQYQKLKPTCMLVLKTTFYLGYYNSCFNPIIYSTLNRDFRRAFRNIFGQGNQLSDTPNNYENTTRTRQPTPTVTTMLTSTLQHKKRSSRSSRKSSISRTPRQT